ncbi:TAP-like protein-domain-containing protein [Xylaria sp. CBS 124048]|nr:TAP-like protein-domain-containing protein [Xylaria sp. CBS 124048]
MLAFRQTVIVGLGLGAAALGWAAPTTQLNQSNLAQQQWVKQSKQQITWGPCIDIFPKNLTCATFNVPLDWDAPGQSQAKETIQLGMIRREADDKANRIGYLFINPGGPGGQATAEVSEQGNGLEPEILAKFDLIGLDPRGVGISTPVQCDPAQFNKPVKFLPKTEDEFNAMVQYNKDLGANCIAKSGRLIQFVDTISAAKDHEAVRIALGEKASFLGLSYGTQLFSQYAQLFPDSFRAMILDGNVQHSQSEASNELIEGTTFEVTLKQFFAWCAANSECVLQNDDVEAVFTSVRDTATDTPIPVPGCDNIKCLASLTAEDILFSIQGFLTSTSTWPLFAEALLAANNGNGTLLAETVGFAIGDAYADSALYAGTAIACQDWTHASTTLAEILQKENLGSVFTPLTRGASQSYKIQTSCIGWPSQLTNPPAPVSYKGQIPLLMINSLFDPETSYAWALGLYGEIQNTVLVTRNGSGHTSYLLNGETTQIANTYLLNLTLPEPGTVTNS